MALSIKNSEVDDLVRAVCEITGESLTSAIQVALRERLERLRQDRHREVSEAVEALHEAIRARGPVNTVTYRESDEALWDESGLDHRWGDLSKTDLRVLSI